MPSLTPPSRVKKAWRIPSSEQSASTLSVIIPVSIGTFDKPGRCRQVRRRQCQNLEQVAHLRRIDQAPQTALEQTPLLGGCSRRHCRQSGLRAERREESTLRHGTVRGGAGSPSG